MANLHQIFQSHPTLAVLSYKNGRTLLSFQLETFMPKALLTGVHNDFVFHSQWDLRLVFMFVCLFLFVSK